MEDTEAMNGFQDFDGEGRFLVAGDYDYATEQSAHSLATDGTEGLQSDVESNTENHIMSIWDPEEADGDTTVHSSLTSGAGGSPSDDGVTTESSHIAGAESSTLGDASTTVLSTEGLTSGAQTLASNNGDTTVQSLTTGAEGLASESDGGILQNSEGQVDYTRDSARGGFGATVLSTEDLTSNAQTLVASENGDTTVNAAERHISSTGALASEDGGTTLQSLATGTGGLASESGGTIVQNAESHVSDGGNPALGGVATTVQGTESHISSSGALASESGGITVQSIATGAGGLASESTMVQNAVSHVNDTGIPVGGAGATVQGTESHISSSGALESNDGVTAVHSTLVSNGNGGGTTVQNTRSHVSAAEGVKQEFEHGIDAIGDIIEDGLESLVEFAEEVKNDIFSLF